MHACKVRWFHRSASGSQFSLQYKSMKSCQQHFSISPRNSYSNKNQYNSHYNTNPVQWTKIMLLLLFPVHWGYFFPLVFEFGFCQIYLSTSANTFTNINTKSDNNGNTNSNTNTITIADRSLHTVPAVIPFYWLMLTSFARIITIIITSSVSLWLWWWWS